MNELLSKNGSRMKNMDKNQFYYGYFWHFCQFCCFEMESLKQEIKA